MNVGNTFRNYRGLKDGLTKIKGQGSIVPSKSEPNIAPSSEQEESEIMTDGEERIAARRQGLADDGVLLENSFDGKSFDDVNAEIKRRDWNEFAANDRPYILNYADEITSGKHLGRAIDQSRTGVEQGFKQAQQTRVMRDKGMGVGLSDAQKSDRASDVGRSKTAALIDAENNARLAGTDRENALLAGSHMPNTGN
jgi:hypothetical protein